MNFDPDEYIRGAHKMVSDTDNKIRKQVMEDIEAIKRERAGTFVTELEAGEIKPKVTNIKYYNMEDQALSKKEKLAHKIYNDYCEAVGGKAFNGDPLPKSEEFFNDPTKTKQSGAWIVAAETAVKFVIENIGI